MEKEINWTEELLRMIVNVEKHGVDTRNWIFLMSVDAYVSLRHQVSPQCSCETKEPDSFAGRRILASEYVEKGDVYFISREDIAGFVERLKQLNPDEMSASFRYQRKLGRTKVSEGRKVEKEVKQGSWAEDLDKMIQDWALKYPKEDTSDWIFLMPPLNYASFIEWAFTTYFPRPRKRERYHYAGREVLMSEVATGDITYFLPRSALADFEELLELEEREKSGRRANAIEKS